MSQKAHWVASSLLISRFLNIQVPEDGHQLTKRTDLGSTVVSNGMHHSDKKCDDHEASI